jgi:hypothetical protein
VEHGDAVGRDEPEVLAAGRELKVGMELDPAAAVLPGREDDEVVAGREAGLGDGRDLPLGRLAALVGQERAREVDEARPGVEELDPVGLLAVLVVEAGAAGRRELVDDDAVGASRAAGDEASRERPGCRDYNPEAAHGRLKLTVAARGVSSSASSGGFAALGGLA